MIRALKYALAILLLVGGLPLVAQDKPATPAAGSPPELSETDKKTMLLTITLMQNASYRIQLAQVELEKLQAELERLIAANRKPGFVLDLQSLRFVPEVKKEKS